MKTFLKIIAIIALIIAGLIGGTFALVFSSTAGITDAADEVLNQIKQGNIEEVYQNSTFEEDSITFEEFEEALGLGTTYDISKVERLSWTGRGFENSNKYIYGDFKFPNGETAIITFWFVKEEGSYKFIAFHDGTP